MIKESKKTVFAIPAFLAGNKVTVKDVPATKEGLVKMLDDKSLSQEDSIKKFPYASHSRYNINKWKTTSEKYTVRAGTGFEPYYVGRRDYPLFDETFYGCGSDKISHAKELSSLGYTFVVLPRGFIVHLSSEGLGKPWCFKNGSGQRGTLKRKVLNARLTRYPGSLNNNYEIPWWKGTAVAEKAPVKVVEEAAKDDVKDAAENIEENGQMDEEREEKMVDVDLTKKLEEAVATVAVLKESKAEMAEEIEGLKFYLRIMFITVLVMGGVTGYYYKAKKRAEKEYKLPCII